MFFHDQATVKDNAAGCVSRLILRFPDKVPLDHVLPVLIDSLPLRQDYGENEVVWDMIVKLCMLKSLSSSLFPFYQSV